MKRLTLAASLVLAVAVPGTADARLSNTQTRAYYTAYAHVVSQYGLRAAGCKLMGSNRTCHVPATDQRVLNSTGVLHRITGPVAYPAASHQSHHFVPNQPAAPAAAPAPAMQSALASYYDLSGDGACGAPAQSGYSFASLILPCGARIVICNGSTCVTATMNDHGPYVAGRTFDLNVNLKDALGCGGLCEVTWRPA
jgi:rare lipoprotein A (peptidoglycan hydrolase)